MGRTCLMVVLVWLSVIEILAAPSKPSEQSLVVSSTEKSNAGDKVDFSDVAPAVPKIYEMHVQSAISNRFAHTTVTSKVKNVADKAQEATFAVVLPETAFISGFIMEVDGKNYTAYVKEKEEAKKDYDQAVASGLGAAHVAVSARDSNRFTVSVNIEPETKAAFYLSYEELLKREDGHYEQVINLHPGQPVKDLSVEVVITESRKIIDLKAPPLRSGNEIGNDKADLDPRADLEVVNNTAAVVRFSPNLERQKQLAHLLGTEEKNGLAGQFVVQYEVERDPKGGEVLIRDGYFVHFFAPTDLAPIPKHVVFVLDTSSSMQGLKLAQLKEAMHKILEQLHPNDLFNLVEFNTNAKVWDLDNPEANVWYPIGQKKISDPCYWMLQQQTGDVNFDNYKFPAAYPVNADNIKKAKDTISKFQVDAATDIYTALRVGLHLVELGKAQNTDDVKRQPIIVFLTDGEPTVRLTNTEEITNRATDFNSGPRKAPVFALSFGDGADKTFLEKLAVRNSGFSKHIYEAADAALQLQDFYKQISSPLLADVTFKYDPAIDTTTKTKFPVHFSGSELVVTGFTGSSEMKQPVVEGWGVHGAISLEPVVERSVSSVERLWAYLTVRQLLEKEGVLEDAKEKEEVKKKALDLAVKYSFVTPVSSLVVVKPNATSAVNTEDGSISGPSLGNSVALSAYQPISSGQYGIGARPQGPPGLPGIPSQAAYYPPGLPGGSHGPPPFTSPTGMPGARPPGFTTPPTPPPIYHTTPFCPELFLPTTTATPKLVDSLPWLNDILNENGTLNVATGEYKLGLDETISDVVACPKTPLGGAGQCKLLHSCHKVHSALTSSEVFVQHLCVLKDEFAGVCCPVDE